VPYIQKMIKQKDIDESKLGKNPLLSPDFRIIVNRVSADAKDGMYQFHDKNTPDEVLLPAEVELERDAFVKLYSHHSKREAVAALGSGAQRLLLWIAYKLKPGKDYIWLDYRVYMKECSISSVNTFKKDRKELWDNNIIAPSSLRGVFWINPEFMFVGSRLKKYPDRKVFYEPKKKEE